MARIILISTRPIYLLWVECPILFSKSMYNLLPTNLTARKELQLRVPLINPILLGRTLYNLKKEKEISLSSSWRLCKREQRNLNQVSNRKFIMTTKIHQEKISQLILQPWQFLKTQLQPSQVYLKISKSSHFKQTVKTLVHWGLN